MTKRKQGKPYSTKADEPVDRKERGKSVPHYVPVFILGLHVLLCVLYNLNTPFGNNGYANTPDEGAHYQYVRFVAENWRLPIFQGYEGVGYEAHQPPLYYFLAALFQKLTGKFDEPGKWVRFLSTIFSGGVVWIVWLTGRRLFPSQLTAGIGAMAFAAFLPMHIAIGSAVGNDSLTNLLFAGSLYAMLLLMQAPSPRTAAIVGILIGLSLLTKATAILLLPLALLALTMAKRSRPELRLSRLLTPLFVYVLLIGGWWFVRNAMLYSDPLLQKTFTQAFAGTAKASDMREAFDLSMSGYLGWVGDWTFKSFWFAYGTPQTANTGRPNFLADWVYHLLRVWGVVILVGFWLRIREELSPDVLRFIILGGACLALVALTFGMFVLTFFQAQGRYFFPALLPISVVVGLGWGGLFSNRYRTYAHCLLAACWFLFACVMLSVLQAD